MISGWMLLADASSLEAHAPLLLSIVCGTIGMWLMLPPSGDRRRVAGAMLSAVALGLLAYLLPRSEALVGQILFWVLAGTTMVAAVATISARSPVYSAIWFALTLLTTAGLFLLQGAQFLSVATITVYAGAILVTFLFVLMLAQPQGQAYYDRISWGRFPPLFAAFAGMLIVGGLTYVVTNADGTELPQRAAAASGEEVDSAGHMAGLGSKLFTEHLVSVEIAGTLLLVALVGAIAIVIQGKQRREQQQGDSADE